MKAQEKAGVRTYSAGNIPDEGSGSNDPYDDF
jgi:hypothetical protein